jgi:RNA polymerase sigma-70 factor (ECF subfamily)
MTNSNTKAFEILYERYVGVLYQFIQKRIDSKEDSKEIVQNVFEWLWMNRQKVVITDSLQGYLFGAAKNQALNYIRTRKIQNRYISHFLQYITTQHDRSTEEMLDLADLETTIERSISELPEKCQIVFRMSRIEHLSNQYIAERMNISIRTVENYMSQALKHLRINLGETTVVLVLLKLLM